MPPDAPANLRVAKIHFQRLAKDFPGSPYRAPANLIISLLAEIENLSDAEVQAALERASREGRSSARSP